MTVVDYRNLRADQKNNDIVASEMALWDELKTELDHLRALGERAGMVVGYAMAQANVPLTRTKDDSLTRREGE